jgi:hypothetical protein
MTEGLSGEPRSDLRVTLEVSPVDFGFWSRGPAIIQTLVMRARLAEMIVRYDDVADIIMTNLDHGGRFSRHRIGVALPKGERGRKVAWQPKASSLRSISPH